MNTFVTNRPDDMATRRLRATLMLGACAALLAAPALARQTAAPQQASAATQAGAMPGALDDEAYEVDALTVTASRQLPGSVIGDIPPELQLSPRDIRAYGVSTVSELITALEPQTSSAQGGAAGGRPVILVNGGRISNFSEVRDIPTEAIARVDILPEEVALKYGYRADQKVINLVLRRRFRATTVEAGARLPTQSGGGDTVDARLNQFRIQRDTRVLIDAKVSDQSALYEVERDIAQPRSDAVFRTLIPKQTTWALNSVFSRPIRDGVSGTINASIEGSDSTSWLGLNTLATGPLRRQSESLTGHIGGGMIGAVKGWRWSVTGNAEGGKNDSTTERVIGGVAYRDVSNSISTSADVQGDFSGTLFRIPAGAATSTVTGGFATVHLESDSVRAGAARSGDLSRDTGSAKLNFDLPLTSVRNDVLPGLGNLSLNLNLAADRLSDFGTLTTIGYGANWSPIEKLRVIASVTRDQGAPSLQQIGDPEQLTPGVQVYDFRRGETAVISRLTGGNRALREEDGRVVKLGLSLKPFDKTNLTLTTNYTNSRTNDLISSFPTATSQIEDAFPERFVRDATGRLVQIDARPINFDRRQTDELRTGFTFRKSFGPQPQPGQFRQRQGQGQGQAQTPGQAQGGAQRGTPATGQVAQIPGQPGAATEQGAPPSGQDGASQVSATQARREGGERGFGGPAGGSGGFGGGGRGPGFGGGGPPGAGTFQIGLYHTVKFTDEIVIRPGLPTLDLLDGASLGSGGGTPKNQIDLQGNLSRNGLGASFNARWQEGTVVRGSGAVGAQDLSFSALTTVSLRVFADLGAQPALRGKPFFRGARISASVDNLFDARQSVRAPDGTTPITYQEDYLDPRGRVMRVSFRKLF